MTSELYEVLKNRSAPGLPGGEVPLGKWLRTLSEADGIKVGGGWRGRDPVVKLSLIAVGGLDNATTPTAPDDVPGGTSTTGDAESTYGTESNLGPAGVDVDDSPSEDAVQRHEPVPEGLPPDDGKATGKGVEGVGGESPNDDRPDGRDGDNEEADFHSVHQGGDVDRGRWNAKNPHDVPQGHTDHGGRKDNRVGSRPNPTSPDDEPERGTLTELRKRHPGKKLVGRSGRPKIFREEGTIFEVFEVLEDRVVCDPPTLPYEVDDDDW
jgi:hypothetical protein